MESFNTPTITTVGITYIFISIFRYKYSVFTRDIVFLTFFKLQTTKAPQSYHQAVYGFLAFFWISKLQLSQNLS